MLTSDIKKGKGIEELLAGYGGQAEIERALVAGSNEFAALMDKHSMLLAKVPNHFYVFAPAIENYFKEFGIITEVLEPAAINAFLQATAVNNRHEDYIYCTGPFMSKLIQNSYDAGHNQFSIDSTLPGTLDHLGAYVKGEAGRPLSVSIKGDTNNWCGKFTEHVIFHLRGNTQAYCGDQTKDSEFTIIGNVGRQCGMGSERSRFYIEGNEEYELGNGASRSTFTITGKLGIKCGGMSFYCTFRTPNQETFEEMKKTVPVGGRVEFIHPDGTIESVEQHSGND